MRRARRITFALALSIGAATAMRAHAEPPQATHKSGEIRGRVTSCAAAGASGAIAHLPGKSFQVRLGPAGDFAMFWVPVGRHSVVIEAPGRAPHTIEDVVVADKRVTELGAITVCRDADGDSATEDVDCNDNNPAVRPGASESCDGFDNDCDGTVDEGCLTCTDADHDGFFAQAGCGGAVDCDDAQATTRPGAQEVCDAVDNDCDGGTDEGFDLQSDPSNCGVCGHVCAISGPGMPAACAAGVCLLQQPEAEMCDGVDNDLDGAVDEDFNVGAGCGCRGPSGPDMVPGVMECTADGSGVECVCF